MREGEAMAIDVERARRETPGCPNVLHFNNAGAALMPQPVLHATIGHLQLEALVGGYEAAAQAHQRLLQAVARLAVAMLAPQHARKALAGGPLDGALVRVAATGALERSRRVALDYASSARASLNGAARRQDEGHVPVLHELERRVPAAASLDRLHQVGGRVVLSEHGRDQRPGALYHSLGGSVAAECVASPYPYEVASDHLLQLRD